MPTSADDVVGALDILTSKSQSAQGPANQINIVNVALAVSGFGPIPIVIARLSDIVTTTGTTIGALSNTKPFTVKADEDAILAAFKTFVLVHQELLNILIGKAGLVPNLLPFVGPPLAQVLRQVESVVDTLAFETIDMVPDNATEFTTQKDSLDKTLNDSINAWSGGISVSAISIEQRHALRNWAHKQRRKLTQKQLIAWFQENFNHKISQSTVSELLSETFGSVNNLDAIQHTNVAA